MMRVINGRHSASKFAPVSQRMPSSISTMSWPVGSSPNTHRNTRWCPRVTPPPQECTRYRSSSTPVSSTHAKSSFSAAGHRTSWRLSGQPTRPPWSLESSTTCGARWACRQPEPCPHFGQRREELMQITVSEQKAFEVRAALTADQVRERAIDQKMAAFGMVSRLLHRPKGEEIKVASTQKRFDPVWHVIAHKRLVFHRSREYRVPVADAAVRRVTIEGTDYPVLPTSPPSLSVRGMEHCEEDLRTETLVDGVRGAELQAPGLARAARDEIPELSGFSPADAVVVP